MIISNKQKIILVGILISIIAILFIYFSQKKNNATPNPAPTLGPLAITYTIPATNSPNISVFDPIMITFNQPVDPVAVTANSDPAEDWTYSQVAPNVIKIDHKLYLRVATTYNLNIFLHGSPIKTIVFETAHEQNDPRFLQGLQADVNKNFPLGSLTPYKTVNFRVIYTAPFTLEIQTVGAISSKDATSQVQEWVKSNGIDPSTHKYIVTHQ